MSNSPKDIRKQVRNVVQEILPELLQTEIFKELYTRLQKDMIKDLELIKNNVNEALTKMDSRSKDVQSFILNSVQAELAKNAPRTDYNPAERTSNNDSLTPRA